MKCKAFFGMNNNENREVGPGKMLDSFKEKSKWTPQKVVPALKLYVNKLDDR